MCVPFKPELEDLFWPAPITEALPPATASSCSSSSSISGFAEVAAVGSAIAAGVSAEVVVAGSAIAAEVRVPSITAEDNAIVLMVFLPW